MILQTDAALNELRLVEREIKQLKEAIAQPDVAPKMQTMLCLRYCLLSQNRTMLWVMIAEFISSVEITEEINAFNPNIYTT